jgi:hypothetical protein
MAQVTWTPQAADDLDAIAGFIAQDSPHFAGIVVADTCRPPTDYLIFPNPAGSCPRLATGASAKSSWAATALSIVSAARLPRC